MVDCIESSWLALLSERTTASRCAVWEGSSRAETQCQGRKTVAGVYEQTLGVLVGCRTADCSYIPLGVALLWGMVH